MVLNVDMLLTENYEAPTSMGNVNTNESYFSMALDFINEMSREYSEANKTFYKTVLEAAENEEIIHESFSDFTSKVKEIIHKFLNFLKSVWNKFIISMNKLVKSDKYIKDHKNEFINFPADGEFEMSIYNYTKLDDDTFPAVSAYHNYMDNLKIYTLSSDNNASITLDSLYSRLTDTYTDITENTNDWYDLFRGEVLNRSGEAFTASEYEQELHDVFRDDCSSKSKETITYGYVMQALERFLGYEKTLKSVKNLKTNLEKEYKSIKDNIKHLDLSDFSVDTSVLGSIFKDYGSKASDITGLNITDSDSAVAKNIRTKIDNINKVRVSRIEGMCSIHSLAFTKKLDAIKEAYNQDKKILYIVLKKIHPISTKDITESYEYMIESDTEIGRLYDTYRYTSSLIEQNDNSKAIIDYVGECIALECGDFRTIEYINESAIDTIKAVISKIIEAIKNMFGKFTTKMNQIFTSDSTYLQKYKDVILKKPFKDRDITMYNYNINKLDDYKVPRFDANKFETLVKCEESEFDEKFIELHMAELPGIRKEGGEIKEKIIEAVRGTDTVDTNLASIDSKRKDMYQFCVQYEKITAMIKKDQATIDNNQTLLNSALSKINSELQDTANKIKQSSNNENVVYSNIYSSYITEKSSTGLDIGKAKKDNGTSGGPASGSNTSNTVVGSGASSINKDDAATAAGNVVKSLRVDVNNSTKDDVDNKVNDAKNKIDEYREGSSRYFRAGADIMAAKLTLCEAIYKDYMKILRTHVGDYGGSASSDNSNVASDGIDSSKVIEIKSDKDGESHTVRYDPTVKPVNITKNRFFNTVHFFKNKKNKDNQNLINGFNKKMMEAAKIILNGKVPTIQQVFFFDDNPCVYSGSDGGWVTCDVEKKAVQKVKDAVKGEN